MGKKIKIVCDCKGHVLEIEADKELRCIFVHIAELYDGTGRKKRKEALLLGDVVIFEKEDIKKLKKFFKEV